jgi:hypothetical protein
MTLMPLHTHDRYGSQADDYCNNKKYMIFHGQTSTVLKMFCVVNLTQL